MTPDQLSKSGTEHGHQRAVFAYCAVAQIYGFYIADRWAEAESSFSVIKFNIKERKPVQALEWIHAIHNQGHGDAIRGAKAKAEGVKAGIADIFWPLPINGRWNYAGLYIEMKKPDEKPKSEGSKGGLSDQQIRFKEYAEYVGYYFKVCYSWQEAVDVIRQYWQMGIR